MSATTSIGGLPGWAIGVIALGAVIGAIAVLAILAGATLCTMWYFGLYALRLFLSGGVSTRSSQVATRIL